MSGGGICSGRPSSSRPFQLPSDDEGATNGGGHDEYDDSPYSSDEEHGGDGPQYQQQQYRHHHRSSPQGPAGEYDQDSEMPAMGEPSEMMIEGEPRRAEPTLMDYREGNNLQSILTRAQQETEKRCTHVNLLLGDQNVSLTDLKASGSDMVKKMLSTEAQTIMIEEALRNKDPVAMQRLREIEMENKRRKKQGVELRSTKLMPSDFKVVIKRAQITEAYNKAPVALGIDLIGISDVKNKSLTVDGAQHTLVIPAQTDWQYERNGGRQITESDEERIDLRAIIGDFEGYNDSNLESPENVMPVPGSAFTMVKPNHPVVKMLALENDSEPVINEHAMVSVANTPYKEMVALAKKCMKSQMTPLSGIGIQISRVNIGQQNTVGAARTPGSSWTLGNGLLPKTVGNTVSSEQVTALSNRLVTTPFHYGISVALSYTLG